MKWNLVSFVVVLMFLCCLLGCKKAKIDSTPKIDITAPDITAPITGTHVWIGVGQTQQSHLDDAFFSFPIKKINDSEIFGYSSDTLKLVSKGASNLVTFEGYDPYSPSYTMREKITYDTGTHIITDNCSYERSSGYYWSFYVSTPAYILNPSIKYLPLIAGTKSMSGIAYDTFDIINKDSMFAVNTDVTFTIISDSNIKFNRDIIGINDTILHYKSTDDVAKTITFQTYHSIGIMEATTLTYNYVNNSTILEYKLVDIGTVFYLKLR